MTPEKLARTLADWFDAAQRELPWRDAPAGGRDPYRTLVCELMLQQTQVSRVIEKFEAFLKRFPTAEALAAAGEADVLAAWSGLGYYRRARLLHAAAKAAVKRFGAVPRSSEDLRSLPGVGPYTAGAIASLSADERTAAVDGNAVRVLLRLRGRDGSAAEARTVRWAWEQAGELVEAAGSPGVFNEALMELGATVCTPKSPDCGCCPWSSACAAREEGAQNRIPRPKPPPKKKDLFISTLVVRDGSGRVLMRERPSKGLWAGMWETPSVEDSTRHPDAGSLSKALGAGEPTRIGAFEHITTHRRVLFEVWAAEAVRAEGRWVGEDELGSLGVSNAQRRVLELAASEADGLFSGRP